MLPCNTGIHVAYQDFFLTEFFFYNLDPFALSKDTWKIMIEFWHLDLSLTDSLIRERYSNRLLLQYFLPARFDPICYLLNLKLLPSPGGLLFSRKTLCMPFLAAFPVAMFPALVLFIFLQRNDS